MATFGGLAGVLTAHRGNPDLPVPAQFQVNARGKITRLTVSTRFVREALRETGYCPRTANADSRSLSQWL